MNTTERCTSTCFGVPCRKPRGHAGEHHGIERGRQEHWQWSDDWSDLSREQPRVTEVPR